MDLSKVSGTITYSIEPLIKNMTNMDLVEIKKSFTQTLRDYDTAVASDMTREYWLIASRSKKTKEAMEKMLKKLYFAGCWCNCARKPTRKETLEKLENLKASI